MYPSVDIFWKLKTSCKFTFFITFSTFLPSLVSFTNRSKSLTTHSFLISFDVLTVWNFQVCVHRVNKKKLKCLSARVQASTKSWGDNKYEESLYLIYSVHKFAKTFHLTSEYILLKSCLDFYYCTYQFPEIFIQFPYVFFEFLENLVHDGLNLVWK